MLTKLTVAIDYAKTFLGLPYIWGGSHPSQGFDCSGLVQEILASVGLDPQGDQTAQTLMDGIEGSCVPYLKPTAGCVLFFGLSKRNISHVAFAISDLHMIEAGGGGSSCITVRDAVQKGAFVRIRPISHRKDLMAILMPRY